MESEHADLQTPREVKRRTYFVSAGLIMLGAVLHSLLATHVRVHLVLVQVLWSTSFAVLGMVVGRGWLVPWLSGSVAALLCLTSATALVLFTGGPASPYLVTLVTIPLLVSMFTPDSWTPTLVSLVAMVAAQLGMGLVTGVPLERVLPQTLTFTLIGSMGLYGGKTYRRLREAEQRAQASRLQALEQLAESERLRRRAETERAQMERLVLVGQLASGVAHEVNNPLAFVKSNLHYLERELLADGRGALDLEDVRELLGETRQGVLRIEQITTDLRRFSREGNGGEEQGSPAEALEEALRLASVRLHGLGEVVADVAPGLPRVRLGQRHLMQVLLNLLINAADAVEEAVPARRARIHLRARRTEGHVRVEVEDNGPGIPPDLLPRVFEPFFTTKAPGKGTGLGLALCREYVARAGGSLTVENRSGGGARFVLTLSPAEEASEALYAP